MRFIVDAQLPPGLAGLLRSLGQEAVAVREVGLREAEDEDIWRYAVKHDLIIVTKDEDFPTRTFRSPTSQQVVWLRIGNASNRALFAWFLPLWPEIERRLVAGDRIVEVQ